jgi:hypothetical protein
LSSLLDLVGSLSFETTGCAMHDKERIARVVTKIVLICAWFITKDNAAFDKCA